MNKRGAEFNHEGTKGTKIDQKDCEMEILKNRRTSFVPSW